MQLTEKEKGILLLCARESITASLAGNPPPQIDIHRFPGLQQQCGAFVTLTTDDDLRGCIGYMSSEKPLYDTVRECALLAATQDPRFEPVQIDEMAHILIEISVLSPMQSLKRYDDIEIGTHGLMLDEDYARGVLLPQVAVEHNMDVAEFLSALCQKAGLHAAEWQNRPLHIKAFTAIVFKESPHRKLTHERH